MNSRERFVRTMTFGRPDRTFLREESFWPETLRLWQRQGHIADYSSITRMFVFDRMEQLPCFTEMVPLYEQKTIAEIGNHYIKQDANGALLIDQKDQASSLFYLKFPIANRRDWEYHKWRFDPERMDERLQRDWFAPGQPLIDWSELEEREKNRDFPLGISVGGYYGWIRGMMGPEESCTIFYEDSDLVREMFQARTDIVVRFLEKILPRFQVEYAHFYEDMCYNHGSLISPKLVREFMLPEYKRITEVLHKYQVVMIDIDTDGNHNELTPLFLEAGVNCLYPYEVAAGMDPVVDRRKYGKQLIIMGGIDKRALSRGKKEIKKEVMEKVPGLIKQGGYVPNIDHGIPPDVPFENFAYYRELVQKIASDC